MKTNYTVKFIQTMEQIVYVSQSASSPEEALRLAQMEPTDRIKSTGSDGNQITDTLDFSISSKREFKVVGY
jgi:hypothetical protein